MQEHYIERVREEMIRNPEAFKKLEGEIEEQIQKAREKLPITLDELESQCQGNTVLEKAFDRVFESFCDYWIAIVELSLVATKNPDGEDFRREMFLKDTHQHIVHEGLIANVNSLAMELKNAGRSIDWIKKLRPGGMEIRSLYGLFALSNIYLELIEMEV